MTTRRSYLTGLVGTSLMAASGCVQETGSLINRQPSKQVSVSIKTAPTDDDPYGIRIAQRLANQLRTVGIKTTVIPMRDDELLHDILVNHEFDLYIAQYPPWDDPDFLYSLLHSRFNAEPGWQNPFGFSDLSIDELLVQQRTQPASARSEVLIDLQKAIVRKQPFAVIAAPNWISATQDSQFKGWSRDGLATPLDYFGLSPTETEASESATDSGRVELQVASLDRRITRNLNPIAVEYRGRGTVTGLLYDPLVRLSEDGPIPALAESWNWLETESTETQTLSVQLRDGLEWHDGESIDAEDAVFTYRFLRDTAIDNDQVTLPAPRFRGPSSLLKSIESRSEHRIRLQFATANRRIARQGLTIPILPKHVWKPRTGLMEAPGIDQGNAVTQARVWKNLDPVGSGPFQFEQAVTDESLVLSRYDDHYAFGTGQSDRTPSPEPVPFDRVEFRIVPSDATAVELLAAEEADATGSSLSSTAVPRIGRARDLRLRVSQSTGFYHLGFNTRRAPLSNTRFRRAIGQLVDRKALVRDIFNDYATPAISPLATTDWLAPALHWRGTTPILPYLGDEDGLNVDRAREQFEAAGYRYGESGQLLRR